MNEHDYIISSIRKSYQELLKNDFPLLLFDANERSITHRLAIYLEKYFPEYNVDCEYNRNGIGRDSKQISNIKQELSRDVGDSAPVDDTSAITVYPDIIIHRRGIPEGFIVIEAKKSNNSTDFDIKKLKAYKRELGYKYAFSIVFLVLRDIREGFPKPNLDNLVKEIDPS